MKIIGLCGAAGSGKDTVAQLAMKWCEEKGINAKRIGFADPLKISAARALGFNGTSGDCVAFCDDLKRPGVELHLHIENTSELGPRRINQKLVNGREFLQRYGTEAHRDVFGPDFWVEVMADKLSSAREEGVRVLFITDVRFANEARLIHKYDGEVWEVVRADNTSLNDGLEAHSSEGGVPDGAIEFQIHNSSNLDALRVLVRSVCEHNLKEDV